MRNKPSLFRLSLFWATVLAVVMTTIGFFTESGLSDPQTGAVSWSRVGLVFAGWLVFAEIIMLTGGVIYFGAGKLFGGVRRNN